MQSSFFHLLTYFLFLFCRFVSITLVFLNKSLLSGGTSVDAPLFITCFQCTVTAAACYAIVSLPPNFWEAKNLSCGQITISIQTLKKVLPLSVVCIEYPTSCIRLIGTLRQGPLIIKNCLKAFV